VDPGSGRVRNTPTLLNAGLQRTQFADQRVLFLEFQFEQVMSNPREMALSPDRAAHRLSSDSALRAHFAVAFGQPEGEAVTAKTLSIAVAAYVRSLQALNSRFDRAIRGDTSAVTASERRGFNLFMGKAAITPPYMHNGVYRTLEEVLDFYDRGGGNGLGMRLPNQTLSPEPLHLSKREKRDVVAFLRSLTDSTLATPSVAQGRSGDDAPAGNTRGSR
jgi:cytochrome c peroxidase